MPVCGETSVAARGWRESNSRPTARQADALPLSHTPKGVEGGVRGARILVSRASTGRLDRLSYHPTVSMLHINHPRFRRGAGRNRTVLEQGCNLLPEPLGHGAVNTVTTCTSAPVPSQSSVSVPWRFLSSGPRVPNRASPRGGPAPARLAAPCESSPAAPGFSRIALERIRASQLMLPTWRA